MYPICFKIGGLTVHWYGVMLALGFMAGLGTWAWLGRRRGWDFAFCSDLLFWVMLAGIAGGRVAYVLCDPGYYLSHPVNILRLDQGGLVYYGGFIGATCAVILFARSRRVPLLALGDLVVTALPLGHAMGRVGCFLNGCCHGRVAAGGWPAVAYPHGSPVWYEQWSQGLITNTAAGDALPVHPVQLYESGFNMVLYAILVAAYRSRPRAGRVAALYFLAYPAGRFFLEYLRGDERIHLAGFTLAQWISLALFAAGCVLWKLSRGKPDAETQAST